MEGWWGWLGMDVVEGWRDGGGGGECRWWRGGEGWRWWGWSGGGGGEVEVHGGLVGVEVVGGGGQCL